MIKNDQQYKIAKAHLANFKEALDEEASQIPSANSKLHPILLEAEQGALKYKYAELMSEIESYEALKSGRLQVIDVNSFDQLPLGLIQARIAKGLSQRELAEKLGLKEQQVQRYEATNYATASFERLNEVIRALEIKINKKIFISDALFSKAEFMKSLRNIGLDSGMVLNKIIPMDLSSKIENLMDVAEDEAKNILLEAVSILGRIFEIDPSLFFKPDSINANLLTVRNVRYKKSVSLNRERISAYTVYAHTLALHILEAVKVKPKRIPTAIEIRKGTLKKYSTFNFRSLLKFIWDLGIPVLPLRDSGSFHGACWRVEGRNIIVLKQRTLSEARWMYDAAHEVCHAGQNPESQSFEVIEGNIEAGTKIEEEYERDANYFAGRVVLGESADDLAVEAILTAKQDLVKLKSAVKKISEREGIDQGLLANYIAFRLQDEQKVNWWGTANNLQNVISDPFEIAREVLFERIDLAQINEFDKGLILRALI